MRGVGPALLRLQSVIPLISSLGERRPYVKLVAVEAAGEMASTDGASSRSNLRRLRGEVMAHGRP
jgi:hypothetical protein